MPRWWWWLQEERDASHRRRMEELQAELTAEKAEGKQRMTDLQTKLQVATYCLNRPYLILV